MIINTSATTVYLGFDNSATTSNGFPLRQNAVWQTNEPRGYPGDVFGIVPSGTSNVRFMVLV